MTYAQEPAPGNAVPGSGDGTPRRRPFGCAFEILETLILTVVIYLLIHNFVAQPFQVQQRSMIPTLLADEYVLIDKLTPRFTDYRRGDIVVFRPPAGYEQEGGVPFIKRVIGIPGDVVSLSNGHVFVTPEGGQPRQLSEDYLSHVDGDSIPTLPGGFEGTSEWTVPEGSFFVLGDNRQESQDSRVFGPVGRDLIVGRGWLRYFPINRVGFLDTPSYAELDGATGPSPALPPSSEALPVVVAVLLGAASSSTHRSISRR